MAHVVCLPTFVREQSPTKLLMLAQHMAVAPNATTAVHCLVQRDATVQAFVDTFFRAERLMQSKPLIYPAERPLIMRSEPLRLEVDGRRGVFGAVLPSHDTHHSALRLSDEQLVAVKREAAR